MSTWFRCLTVSNPRPSLIFCSTLIDAKVAVMSESRIMPPRMISTPTIRPAMVRGVTSP